MKVAVLTAMVGEYDSLAHPEYQDKEFDYFFFTDTSNSIKGYKRINIGSDGRLDKRVKVLPFEYLKGYDTFIWHDANMVQVSSLKPLLESVDKDMAFLNHPSRKCITQELEAIAYYKKAPVEQVSKQVQSYLSEGMPIGNGLWECGVSIRKNTVHVQDFCKGWYKELDKSFRDQLSFAYMVWKSGMDINWLHTCTYRGREFKMNPHNKLLQPTTL